MSSTNTHFVNTFLEALMRLVRHLFGRGRVEDAEEGKGAPMELKSVGEVLNAQGDIPTFKPDLVGVPALTMSVGAAFTSIPTIVVTPPDDKDGRPTTARARQPSRTPLQRTTVTPTKRVHGRTPPCKRVHVEKENIAAHPNAPQRPVSISLYADGGLKARAATTSATIPSPPSSLATTIESKRIEDATATAQPGSLAWERAKAEKLEEVRAWSAGVKARHHRRSLPAAPAAPWVPAPLVRRASVSSTPPLASCVSVSVASPSPRVRLPLAERLKRAVAVCTPPTPEPVLAPAVRLWSDDKGLFSLGFEKEEKKEERTTSKVVPQVPDTSADTSLGSLSSSDSLDSLSSSGSMEDILDQFDDLLHSPAWLGRRRFPEVEGQSGSVRKGADDGITAGRAHRDSTWSEVFSLDAYA